MKNLVAAILLTAAFTSMADTSCDHLIGNYICPNPNTSTGSSYLSVEYGDEGYKVILPLGDGQHKLDFTYKCKKGVLTGLMEVIPTMDVESVLSEKKSGILRKTTVILNGVKVNSGEITCSVI